MRSQTDDLGLVGVKVADWDIRLAYPYRTITTDYTTWITYISRRKVPANTPLTDIRYWKPITRLDKQLQLDYQNFKNEVAARLQSFAVLVGMLQKQVEDMNTQMQSFIATASGGQAFSNQYGTSEVMGVTQKTLTDTIKGIYQLIADTTGVDMNNVEITITPDAFLKPQGQVNVSAVAEYGVLDSVKVYFNNVLKVEEESVKTFSQNFTINAETEIKVEAVVLGRLYTKTTTVRMSTDFFIGAGESYEDVYNPVYSRPYDGDPQGAYQITVEEGQHIVIILPTADAARIEQIEMNDFNILMDTTTFGIYTAYTSVERYQAGTYTIDINY